jgi:hypothetical protein
MLGCQGCLGIGQIHRGDACHASEKDLAVFAAIGTGRIFLGVLNLRREFSVIPRRHATRVPMLVEQVQRLLFRDGVIIHDRGGHPVRGVIATCVLDGDWRMVPKPIYDVADNGTGVARFCEGFCPLTLFAALVCHPHLLVR